MGRSIKFTLNKKDFSYQWYSGKGAGGQHRNKHQNCFRIRHIDSGVVAIGQSHKERILNKKEALKNLTKNPIFKSWCNIKLKEIENGYTIKEIVDELMDESNLKIEVKDKKGKWINVKY